MTTDLKPCPFCGGEAHITHTYDPDGFGAFHHAQCRKCRAKGTEYFARETCPIFFEQVRAAWNTRAKTKAADALEAKLCAVVKPLEWHIKPDTTYKAEGVAGVYEVYPNQQGNWTLDDGMSVSGHEIPCAAKEAGNKEEAKRTISTITIRSASDIAAEARAGVIEAAAYVARNACLVPPDGGSPTQAEADVCDEAYRRIRALHDTDTLAAIERIKEQARKEERERLIDTISLYPQPHSNRIIAAIMEGE